MQIITDIKKLNAGITSLGNRSKKMDSDIHQLACSCLAYIHEHGQITPLNDLMKAMPKGTRFVAVRKWAEDHAGIEFVKGQFVYVPSKAKRMHNQPVLAKAIETPFWEYTTEPEPKPFNLMQAIAGIVSRADKRFDDEGKPVNKQDVIPSAALEQLKRMLPKQDEVTADTLKAQPANK